MSEDILAKMREELQPKTTKEGLIYLAAEIHYMRRDVNDLAKLQTTQNGKCNKNTTDIARMQGQMSAPWTPHSKRRWFGVGTALLAFVTLAATFEGKLIEQVSWWP